MTRNLRRWIVPITVALTLTSNSAHSASQVPYSNQRVGQFCKASDLNKFVNLPTAQKLKCVNDGSRNRWTLTNISATNSSKKNPTKLPNDLIGMTWTSHRYGTLSLDLILRDIKSGNYFYRSGLSFKTSFPDHFQALDAWDDKILGCPSYCLSSIYVTNTKTGPMSEYTLDDMKHPDQIWMSGLVKGANFGKDSRYLFTLVQYQPIEGVNSVVFRIDTANGTKTPIYATYCSKSIYHSCSMGYSISSMRVDHHSNKIYLVVKYLAETGAINVNPYLIYSINQDSTGIILNKWATQGISNSFFQGSSSAGEKSVVSDSDYSKEIRNPQPSMEEGDFKNIFYIRTSGKMGAEINEICSTGLTQKCLPAIPFKFIRNLIAVSPSKALFISHDWNSLESLGYNADFANGTVSEVANISYLLNFEDFGIYG